MTIKAATVYGTLRARIDEQMELLRIKIGGHVGDLNHIQNALDQLLDPI